MNFMISWIYKYPKSNLFLSEGCINSFLTGTNLLRATYVVFWVSVVTLLMSMLHCSDRAQKRAQDQRLPSSEEAEIKQTILKQTSKDKNRLLFS